MILLEQAIYAGHDFWGDAANLVRIAVVAGVCTFFGYRTWKNPPDADLHGRRPAQDAIYALIIALIPGAWGGVIFYGMICLVIGLFTEPVPNW